MEENFNENKEEKNKFKECECSNDRWIKFALITAAVFLGSYLASYVLLNKVKHSHPSPISSMPSINNIIKEQEKGFKDLESLSVDFGELMHPHMPVVQTFRKDDAYKIIIDLNDFDNDAKNIKIKIEPDFIGISGRKVVKDASAQSEYSFTQNFSLPEKIDVRKAYKEMTKDKIVITLPIIEKAKTQAKTKEEKEDNDD